MTSNGVIAIATQYNSNKIYKCDGCRIVFVLTVLRFMWVLF